MSATEDELLALESIYPDYVSSKSVDSQSGQISLRLEIPVRLSPPKQFLIVEEHSPISSAADKKTQYLDLGVLPPLLLHFILPASYPEADAPEIVSISTSFSWLRSTRSLQLKLLDMWTEGEGVLCTWTEYLENGLFFDDLDEFRPNELDALRLTHPMPHQLKLRLLENEKTVLSSKFASSAFTCSMCFDAFSGAKCVQIQGCGHVFCRTCLEEFWKLLIREGDVTRITCPDPECVKKAVPASEDNVQRVVTQEELERLRWLREKQLFDKDPTVIPCPLTFCQRPVPKPSVSEAEAASGWDRLRTCSSCSYSFCAYCKRTWHGPISHCPVPFAETFLLSYLEMPEKSEGRQTIERRYGRTNVLRLVKQYEEDQENLKWFDESTTACPGCSVRVQKSHGCNHMTCVKCKQHFCYRCGQRLHPNNVYKHFSTPGQPCYMKLFDEVNDHEWEPMEAFDDFT